MHSACFVWIATLYRMIQLTYAPLAVFQWPPPLSVSWESQSSALQHRPSSERNQHLESGVKWKLAFCIIYCTYHKGNLGWSYISCLCAQMFHFLLTIKKYVIFLGCILMYNPPPPPPRTHESILFTFRLSTSTLTAQMCPLKNELFWDPPLQVINTPRLLDGPQTIIFFETNPKTNFSVSPAGAQCLSRRSAPPGGRWRQTPADCSPPSGRKQHYRCIAIP